jgi:fructosamine-3-kinase
VVLLPETLRRHLETLLSCSVRALATVPGGDSNYAYRIHLSDGRRVFVKTSRNAASDAYSCEAEGLAYLRVGLEDSGLNVPDVIAVSDTVLVLDFLEVAEPRPFTEEILGRGLAALHRAPQAKFGFEHDNYIGPLVQPGGQAESWAEFYGQRRLLHQARQPGADRLLDRNLRRRLDRLVLNLETLLGPSEPPARLHGDLWGGNWLPTARGPYLVDPAVYAGHREIDLAMMRLFGGFSERVFGAYQEAFPLNPGFEERLPIHQLYPLLVHLNLFGAGYLGSVSRILGEYG